MKEINVPNWPEALEQSGLPDRQRKSYRITIGWFLGFCRRGRSPVTHPAARDFIDWARAQKNPQPWQLEGWKEAIRWFFRAGQRCPAKGEAGPARSAEAPQVPRPAEKPPEPLWKVEFLKVLRRRHYSYRTVRRAKIRPRAIEWLNREELDRLWAHLAEPWRLMAQGMYGGGLRLMELLRLRVKDVDLEKEIITVRGGKGDNYAKVVVMQR